MSINNTLPENKINQAKTRLLLALLEAQEPLKKSQLNSRVVPKKEKVKDYQSVFNELQEFGAIKKSKQGYSLVLPKGLELLDESLKTRDFVFEGTIVGTWAANALLKFINENSENHKCLNVDSQLLNNTKIFNKNEVLDKQQEHIESYGEFESQVLSLFEKLDKSYNYSGLVPIWHLRRELSKQVSPEKFNDWMMQMQASQLLYLQSGEARGASEDEKQDSIHSEIRGLLFFASKLS
ncbi:MAG: hypothetical protein SWZ49_07200 [Cyanobacteriota bacterium]|nr:hypothetical protein [Cyanobacteriota bacterium]